MLSPSQHDQLAAIVRQVNAELQIETATLDAEQTLEVVLCNDFVCLRPIRISSQAVDIPAALAGQPEAQRALQAWLRVALTGQ